jgi:hypothetical protein
MAWAITPWAIAMAPAAAPTTTAMNTSHSSLERIWPRSQARALMGALAVRCVVSVVTAAGSPLKGRVGGTIAFPGPPRILADDLQY